MNTIKTKLNFPIFETFSDYHDANPIQRFLTGQLGIEIMIKEVAFDGQYWIMFYIGEEPPEDYVKDFLKNQGIKTEYVYN